MRVEKVKRFRSTVAESAVDGMFFKSTDPAFVEAAGKAGLAFSILDMEHGPADFKTIENLVRATETSAMLPIVRTSANEPWMISRALDTGAAGVQIPNVGSVEEARKAIQAARFYPQGQRGVCRFVRAADYGNTEKKKYFQDSNDAIVVLMVEGTEGLSAIEQILELEGFDVVFIGPYDLSQSLEIPGDIYNPMIQEHLQRIVKLANEHNKQVGTFYDEPSRKEWFISCGIHYLAYSVDTEIFRQACAQLVQPA